MVQPRPTIGFIGAGVTGTALASELYRCGYHISSVYSRSPSSSMRLASRVQGCAVYHKPQDVADNASIVFITTPDDIIEDIASGLKWHAGQTVVHCSGVHSTEILESAHKYGAFTCCLHPLQTFANIEEAIHNISGSTFALEGDEPAMAAGRLMAAAMKGTIITLKPGDKVLYHAAAVTLSNYLVTLMKTAADFWQSFGIPQDEAVKALLPLLKGTVNNIERVGIPDCLTGPIARGDVRTVEKHVNALRKEHPELLEIYRVLGLKTLPIALTKGHIGLEIAEEIRELLQADSASGIDLNGELESNPAASFLYHLPR
ncbi:MAG: DUF2520 domain-containing protein [Dehalococcoidia bacterium]